MAFVDATAAIVGHSTCIPYGSRKSTARRDFQFIAQSFRISTFASVGRMDRDVIREIRKLIFERLKLCASVRTALDENVAIETRSHLESHPRRTIEEGLRSWLGEIRKQRTA